MFIRDFDLLLLEISFSIYFLQIDHSTLNESHQGIVHLMSLVVALQCASYERGTEREEKSFLY